MRPVPIPQGKAVWGGGEDMGIDAAAGIAHRLDQVERVLDRHRLVVQGIGQEDRTFGHGMRLGRDADEPGTVKGLLSD
jgi:hypothetical protein